MRNLIFLFLPLFFLLVVPGYGQQVVGKIAGVVTDESGEPVPFANIFFKELLKGTLSKEDGSFLVKDFPVGTHRMQVSSQGYQAQEREVFVTGGKTIYLEIALKEQAIQLKDVMVAAKSKVEAAKEEPFTVAAIDAKAYHNLSSDINMVLEQAPGISIREEGGFGSGFDLNLNGLYGKQVKFFIDGIPLENLGNSLSLNNFPTNLVERIEVYKGVVPVQLGSDALGGAINIISRQTNQDYLDVSYSVGSFDTHRAALNGQFYNDSSGFTVKTSAFYNYSANNYKIQVRLPDPETGQYGQAQKVRRFHDAYRSQMVQLKAGWRQKAFADELFLGLTASGNHDDVQHAISLDRVFGEVYTKSQTIMPHLQYQKHNFLAPGFSLKAYVAYGLLRSAVTDTSSRQYNWLGEYVEKNNKDIGEFRWQKSRFSYHDNTAILNLSGEYQMDESQQLTFNYTQNYLRREGDDPLSPTKVPFEDPNTIDKKVAGLAYSLKLLEGKWRTTAFGKYYLYNAEAVEVNWDNQESKVVSSFQKPGYGLATTYYFSDKIQLKSSFEKTYRLPEGFEMFGDGLLVKNNPYLVPEMSFNGNLGLRVQQNWDKWQLRTESNLFVRDSKNWIRIEAQGIISQYVNVKDVRSSGVEGDISLHHSYLSLGANATYQHLINTTRFEKGRESYVYLDRIPNIPYFFGNIYSEFYMPRLFSDSDQLSFLWRAGYVHEYFLKWPSLGDPNNKHIIPGQFTQDVELSYAASGGTYNLSLACRNLTDALVYDHFRLQKPGRSFYLKLRYFIETN